MMRYGTYDVLVSTCWEYCEEAYTESAKRNLEEYGEEWDYYDLDKEIDFISQSVNGSALLTLKKWACNVEGFLVNFNLGLWNGNASGWYMASDWDDMLNKLLEDEYQFQIAYSDGHLEITNWHHDGENMYEVYPLTRDGMYFLADENGDEIAFDHELETLTYRYDDDEETPKEKKSIMENLKAAVDHKTILRMPWDGYMFK